MADYKVLLLQRDWTNTEVFEITAGSEKAALAEAEKIVNTKDLKDKEWKLEAREVEAVAEPGAEPVAPPEPEER